jgi:hypothetical protein
MLNLPMKVSTLMKIEGYILGIDELMLGFNMSYGQDEYGKFHQIEIGLLIVSISFIKYFK